MQTSIQRLEMPENHAQEQSGRLPYKLIKEGTETVGSR